MTPDWKTAMEREADSVDDPVWAAQTRRAAAWEPVRGLPADMVLSVVGVLMPGIVFWWAWIVLVNCSLYLCPTPVGCWLNDSPQALDAVLALSLLIASFALGLAGVRRRVGVAVFALLPVGVLAVAGAVELLGWQPGIVLDDGQPLRLARFTGLNTFILQASGGTVLAFLGLGLGRWLRARWGERA